MSRPQAANPRKGLSSAALMAVEAYQAAAFPMARHGIISYYAADPRSVFFFDSFHIPRRLARRARQRPFELKLDTAFAEVVQGCRSGREAEEWIDRNLAAIYGELHAAGLAHSFEAWEGGDLVGGVFGTAWGAAFCAESMFHRRTDASSLSLVFMMETLRAGGFHFCDIQYANPHTMRFNPTEVPQALFERMFAAARRGRAKLSPPAEARA